MPCAYTPGSLASDHLSLIFLIILLFAAYPAAFAALSLAFLRTFHLVLAGMVRRGAAFVFRTYRTRIGGAHRIWGRVIAIASTLPGAPDHPWCDRDRGLRVVDGVVQPFAGVSWLQPFPLALGALTLVLCANLAAVATRGNFRRRGLGIGMVAGVVSVFTLVLLIADAPRR